MLAVGAALAWSAPSTARVAGTAHDFSAGGPPGQQNRVCGYCHTPHSGTPVLPEWAQGSPGVFYTPYSSPSLDALVGQPTGSSKVCLSCHDGTIGAAQGPPGGSGNPPPFSVEGRADLSTDLSDDHPISFVYDVSLATQDAALVNPGGLPPEVRLDRNGELQCSTCHEPHTNANPHFLVRSDEFSDLCLSCHDKAGWDFSSHATSNASWSGAGADPWPYTPYTSVAANACSSCHTPHGAGYAESLLVYATEEENCLSCHDGSTAQTNLAAEMVKPFGHAVDRYLGIHEAFEDELSMPVHVECHDCHNPHAASDAPDSAPNVRGPLRNAPGISIGGTFTNDASFEYEVCLRCHADGPEAVAPYIERQILEPNVRLKFVTTNPSFHPIADRGRNSNVPSLISPMDENTILYCTDCHANDGGPGNGGNGPAGPHASNWPALLERQYITADGTGESTDAYALCYKCHSRDSILNDQSFAEHDKHIRGEDTPCSICHDPHGISGLQGNATNNSHLINFDTTVVFPDPQTGRLEFEDLGSNRGRCYLDCHGMEHSPESY
jgi:predicted CXXCH cytochrome family protein